jgi:hypothetical protein
VRFQVLKAVSIKFRFVFWDVLPCKIIAGRRFRGMCCLHHQGDRPGRALPPGKGPPVPIGQEAGWAPEPVWTQRIGEKSFASAEDRTPIVQSVVRHCTDWATQLLIMLTVAYFWSRRKVFFIKSILSVLDDLIIDWERNSIKHLHLPKNH